MQINRAITLCLVAALGACSTPDKGVWETLEAGSQGNNARGTRDIQPAGAAPVVSTGEPRPTETADPTAQAQEPAAAAPQDGAALYASPRLPRNAAPSPEIAGLGFLTGRWTAVNPNNTVNEETWSPPRGNALIGAFRQVRLDGDCAFVELSQIALEAGDIVLRLRHLHGRLEVPADRSEVSVFRLVKLHKDRVEFTGTTGAEGVTSVVYERRSPTELVQSIGFAPETGQKAFVTRYSLDISQGL